MNPSQSFSIEQSYINLALVETKEHQEKEKQLRDTRNNTAVMEKFEEIHGTKIRIDIKDIFTTCKNSEKKVLVFGRAGIGKSTFCRYVAHQWACGAIWSEYDLVVLVPLRSLTEQNYPALSAGVSYDLIDVLRKTCFNFRYSLPEAGVTFLKDHFRRVRILWLLDGYDEIVQNVPTHLQHLLGQLLSTSHHIVTSRPYQNTLSYQVRMELIGFTDDNIPKYITQFFGQVETQSSNSLVEEKKLSQFVKLNPRIWGIAHIPINLELICSVWSNTDWSETKAMTITMLYEELTEWLCRRYLESQRRISIDQINLMDRQTVYQNCRHEMAFLESLAFRGMKQNYVLLPSKLLAEAVIESQCSLIDHTQLLNTGLLKSIAGNGTGSQVEARKDHYFVHLSFQEYFGARYLVNALRQGDKPGAISFIRRQRYNQRCTLLFRFASGLAVESNCRQTIELFWNTLQSEPVDLIGIRHIKLLITCFDEVFTDSQVPNSDRMMNCIQNWIHHVLHSNNRRLQDYLSESFQECISISGAERTQNELSRIIQQSEDPIKMQVLRLISELELLSPRHDLLRIILDQLGTSNKKLKMQALTTLASLGEKARITAVIDRLSLVLDDEDPLMRPSACEALVSIDEKETNTNVIDRLFLALGDTNSDVRSSACEALGRIGRTPTNIDLIDRLYQATKHENPEVRSSAYEALGRIGEKATNTDVIDGLFLAIGDTNSDVRSSACEALGRIGRTATNTDLIDRLYQATKHENPEVRSSAYEALGRIGEKATNTDVIDSLFLALGDKNFDVRWSACETLVSIGANATNTNVVDRLFLALGDTNSDVRSSACDALGRLSETVVYSAVINRLCQTMKNENPVVRSSACTTLGCISEIAVHTAVIDVILLALGDTNSDVRSSACKALGHLSETVVQTVVIDALLLALGDTHSDVRSSACDALGRISETAVHTTVIDRLCQAMKNENPVVRSSACAALERIGENATTTAVVDALLLALEDTNSDVRSSACDALGHISEKAVHTTVIDALFLVLGDKNPNVRSSACDALGHINETVVHTAVINRLCQAMKDENPVVRSSACAASWTHSQEANNHRSDRCTFSSSRRHEF